MDVATACQVVHPNGTVLRCSELDKAWYLERKLADKTDDDTVVLLRGNGIVSTGRNENVSTGADGSVSTAVAEECTTTAAAKEVYGTRKAIKAIDLPAATDEECASEATPSAFESLTPQEVIGGVYKAFPGMTTPTSPNPNAEFPRSTRQPDFSLADNPDGSKTDTKKETGGAGRLRAGAEKLAVNEGDIIKLTRNLREAYDNLRKKMCRVNVLLAGASGAGKSQLINAVFTGSPAATGVGAPVTQNYHAYGQDEGGSLVVFDCKGLEHGESDLFVSETKKFLAERRIKGDSPENGIHVVWYVINLANARVADYVFDLWRNVYADHQLICVLNKADLVEPDVVREMKEYIERQAVPCCKAVVVTVADTTVQSMPLPHCPSCGGKRLVSDFEDLIAVCKECGVETSIRVRHGLRRLTGVTMEILPDVVSQAFVCAQMENMSLKDRTAKKTIEAAIQSTPLFDTKALCSLFANLGRLFEFTSVTSEMDGWAESSATAHYSYLAHDMAQSLLTYSETQVEMCYFGCAAYSLFRKLAVEYLMAEAETPKVIPATTSESTRIKELFQVELKIAEDAVREGSIEKCLEQTFPKCSTVDGEEASGTAAANNEGSWWKVW